MKYLFSLCILLATATLVSAHSHDWKPTRYSDLKAYAPTPIPERVVLTWTGDPATTQAVSWRTDTSVKHGIAELAIANSNGRALKPDRWDAVTTTFKSDINEANYHTVEFTELDPDTLYTYRVGDGLNWSEYFHFKTASTAPEPFTFIYFGDAQNEVKTHWSRVFREAFRDAPRAAFSLHAGDLINLDEKDSEWGDWHGAPAWVNGTVPVIAVPGNHEYYKHNRSPNNERYWTAKDGRTIAVDITLEELEKDLLYRATAKTEGGKTAMVSFNNKDQILEVDQGFTDLTGYTPQNILGSKIDGDLLADRLRNEGEPRVSNHWRPQFAFPLQKAPEGLEETCYYIDYQDVRIVALDSNRKQEEQIPWLRNVLTNNPNRWTILTFHHPMFSPARDRDNKELRGLWKTIIDEFKVDLVLNGHDHSYSRTGALPEGTQLVNVPDGYQQAYDPDIGTVFVVSVSGPKMYPITKGDYAVRLAENTQLYQVIDIETSELHYKAYTATGQLYDAFTIKKRPGQPNELREILPPENRGD
ncbi:MAG: fibronectin type III domain-containing protein [Opitutales bacterium]|nr:fibronectin type III domain-containing protein [Opitutales bacterium]